MEPRDHKTATVSQCNPINSIPGLLSQQKENNIMQLSTPKILRLLVASLLAAVLVALGYAVWTHFHQSHDHAHGPDDHGVSILALSDGKRWATDEPLRIGMQRIRDAVAPALASHDQAHLNPEQAKTLTNTVQENVTFLIQNCKLAPEADAVLHVLITELLDGAALVSANPPSVEGVAKLAHALREYPKYFEHPGWSPFSEPK